jgi:branched-chain amino acid aminotransferase
MNTVTVNPEVKNVLSKFQLPDDVGFGKVMAPIMIEADYADGKWGPLELKPYGPITLDPTAKVLHYAQEIFEGLKAYKTDGKGPYLFRPEGNAERFNASAARMAMPDLPIEYFVDGCKVMTAYCSEFIPPGSGETLYLRPYMFATEENLGIKPSEKFKFLIIASPSGNYFSSGSVTVGIERDAVRACPGGVGMAKTGGNYAASLLSAQQAIAKKCQQILWLDAVSHERIEEMSGMNFMCVIDGDLHTPELTETILDGITRKSLLELARRDGLNVIEREMKISELIEDIKSGRCTEAFACGTAAIITPINALQESDDTQYKLTNPEGPVAAKLRSMLLDIQEGRLEGPDGWVVKVDPPAV